MSSDAGSDADVEESEECCAAEMLPGVKDLVRGPRRVGLVSKAAY